MDQDSEHLRLLSIFHYVLAAITALVACFPLIHLTVGISMFSRSVFSPDEPAQFFALMFIIIPVIFILGGWAFAVCLFLTGRYLANRKHHLFCLITAGVNCMFAPLGTALGVFTIIVLMRPSVKGLFDR